MVRPALQKGVLTNTGTGRTPTVIDWDAIDQQLFFSASGIGNMKQSLHCLFKQIKKINPQITSGNQIRMSVIVEWCKRRGIREVQYMAGHRYISSTERYQVMDMEALTESLNMYHPLL